jgi:cell division protein FtsL
MASLATLYNRMAGANAFVAAQTQTRQRAAEDPFALRAIANEDIFFFVKDIDNSRVVRESDPQARTACWKLILSAGAAAVLLIGVLLPSAYGLLAGYQIQSLRAEQQRLTTERSALELEEAKLLSPARLEELARIQSFVDPGPQKVVYLDGKGSVAMLKK